VYRPTPSPVAFGNFRELHTKQLAKPRADNVGMNVSEPKRLVTETRRHIPKLTLVTAPANEESPLWIAPIEEGPPSTSQVLHVPIGSIPHEIEAKILAVLHRPRQLDESYAESSANRETELGALFAELDVTRAFHLRRRLETACADDPLWSSFQRLVVNRRQRLLRFLGDARRRSALATTECDG
jgi:hypothetical protein